jgi:opacity protein-like surface antigen
MKKILILSIILLSSIVSNAQNNKLGIGAQYSATSLGLSIKYNLDKNSTIQGTINPISAGTFNINFYGGRYYYHFPQDNSPLRPYVYGGAGLITFNYKLSGISGGILNDSSSSFFGYSAGGGLAFDIIEKLEGSADIGYGKIDISSGLAVSSATLGIGIHYYIK